MPVATFDTLKFANALKAAGVSAGHAEAEAQVLAEVFSINFRDVTTKEDLQRAVDAVEGKIREVEQRLNAKFEIVKVEMRELEQRLVAKIDQSEQRMITKFDLLKAEVRESEQRTNSKFDLVKWMMGVIITLLVGIAIRLFFFKPI